MTESDSVTIEKIIAGGSGLGRLSSGVVVLIPGVLPGEKVRFTVKKRHKSYLEAEATEIDSESPHRVVPPCKYYPHCGGCDLQHTDYESQLSIKDSILKELLSRAKINPSATDSNFLLPPVPSPEIFAYRQRLRLQVSDDGKPGFYRHNSHEVIPIKSCMLAGHEINSILTLLHEDYTAGSLLSLCSSVEILLNPQNSKTVLILHLSKRLRPHVQKTALELCHKVKNLQGIVFSAKGQGFGPWIAETDHGPEVFHTQGEELLMRIPFSNDITGVDFELTLEPGGFCQVNRKQNENCMKILLDWADPSPTDNLLDLYCGMGNFTIPFAMRGAEAVGLDFDNTSIRSAERNALLTNLSNCRFSRNSALEGIKQLLDNGEKFDLLLLDPPRSGCKEVIPYISRLGVKKILMVSCDPATLTRDLLLLQDSGYILERIQIVDMFPQTHHIETVSLLSAHR